jgi:hypothetical protein
MIVGVSVYAGRARAADDLVIQEPIEVSAASMAADTLAFWTRDAIAAATAMVMVDYGSPDDGVFEEPGEGVASVDLGVPGTVGGGRAGKGSNAFHRQAYAQDWEGIDIDAGALYIQGDELESLLGDSPADVMAGTSQVYTYYSVNTTSALWKLYPHRWEGKFTFTTPAGNSSCSATSISNNHILTAAHCVYDTPSRNAWYTNKAFTPAYRNGSAPYGTFPTTGCTVLTAWVNLSGGYSINSWARHDVAVCNAGTNSAGSTLNNAVGWAGRSWNYDYNQLHFNAGYPARSYTDALLSSPAQYLRSCTAESFYQTTDTLGMGCYYGRGISGGSWLRNYRPNYLSSNANSVNSGLYIGTQNLYGARFTSNNIVALCNATGC